MPRLLDTADPAAEALLFDDFELYTTFTPKTPV